MSRKNRSQPSGMEAQFFVLTVQLKGTSARFFPLTLGVFGCLILLVFSLLFSAALPRSLLVRT
jgi:hypothetical protein